MKIKLLSVACMLLSIHSIAQGVAINTSNTAAHSSALLDVSGNQSLHYYWLIYLAAAELKVIIQGVGNGFVISSPVAYFYPAPQKVLW